ncbi:MAG TPA: hypothetical protein VF668_13640 [Pyrinomonadaceae bacterium]|jgi:hypothetical protein
MKGTLLTTAVVFALAPAAGCAPPSRGAAESGQRAPRPNTNRAAGSGAPAPRAGLADADYERHVARLKKRLPSERFHVVVEKPFVVVGDGGRREVEGLASGTVRWAVEMLKRDFFEKDPAHILDVWLFKDSDSYRTHARELFGREPTTPYGYYSAADRALVMNIETGSGTLVHEIVHPFVEADFPGCPPWLNEGLGSLFEQSGEEGGRIRGYTNWRLPGLQRAVRRGGLTPFPKLLAMDARAFYDDGQGVNYAQARYLCYYLQERGLLPRFYRDFRAARAADPDGLETLKKTLGESDMEAFQKKWERFVLGLVEEMRLTPVAP